MKRLGLLLAGILIALSFSVNGQGEDDNWQPMPEGDADRGRLIFGTCRTCHYAQQAMGHNNGPNLHRIFGRVVGSAADFAYYSAQFKEAQFIWTPEIMYAWLESPGKMFPTSTMMSLGIEDPQRRADLIAFLQLASVRSPQGLPAEKPGR